MLILSKVFWLQNQETEEEEENTIVANDVANHTFSFEFPLPQQHPFSTPPAGLWPFSVPAALRTLADLLFEFQVYDAPTKGGKQNS